jgi:Ca2+-binding EF-hand superfamily protein
VKHIERRIAAFAFAAVSVVAMPVGSAGAQQVNEDAIRKTFAEADVNGDGALNLDEFVGHVIYVFKRVDTNGDRVITVEEAIAFNPAHGAANLKAADRSGDGRLSVGEVAAAKVLDFFEMDTNRDGVVTVEEVIVYERRIVARPAAK